MLRKNGTRRANTKIAIYSVQGHFLRHMRLRQVDELMRAGRALWKRDGSGRIVGCRLASLDREAERSPAAITFREMQFIAGMSGESRTARLGEAVKRQRQYAGRCAEDAVERAMNKLAAFAVAMPSDMKAVKVWPRGTVLIGARC